MERWGMMSLNPILLQMKRWLFWIYYINPLSYGTFLAFLA